MLTLVLVIVAFIAGFILGAYTWKKDGEAISAAYVKTLNDLESAHKEIVDLKAKLEKLV